MTTIARTTAALSLLIFSALPAVAQISAEVATSASESTATYLGQPVPGKIAQIFAPQVLKFEPHGSPIIAQDETWLMLATFDGVKFYALNEGQLSPTTNPLGFEVPEITNALAVSPSEKRAYFLIWKDTEDDFYVIEKDGSRWTAPVALKEDFVSLDPFWQFSIASSENLYFAARGVGLFRSVFDGEEHLKPVQLTLEDGGKMSGESPFIAPDESYLVFTLEDDLHISYNMHDGRWTIPRNLGPGINSDKKDLCPKISPDGKYLFFNSRRNAGTWAIYWAEAGFIEDLRPKSLK